MKSPPDRETEGQGAEWRVRERLGGLLPEPIRKNLTLKFLLLLLIAITIGVAVAGVSYMTVNDALTEQVESQIESDTTIQATIYENWLAERLSTINSIARAPEMQHESTTVLHQWLIAEQTSISEDIDSLHVIDTESGEVLGSTDTALQGMNLYARGLNESSTEPYLFVSERPLRLRYGGEKMTLLGTHTGDRMLIAAVPANTTLVNSTAFAGARSGLYSLDGHRLIGNNRIESVAPPADGDAKTAIREMDGSILGTHVLAHDVLSAEPREEYDSVSTVGTMVVTTTPKSAAYAFRSQILNILIATLSLTFLLLVGSAVVSMRSITSEINRLSQKAGQISEGTFKVDMSSNRADEIGRLYESISDMRDSLEGRLEQVKQRRDELEAAREEAQRARQELRGVIDLVPDRIFARNADGEYLLANEATASGYGLTPETIEEKKLSELGHDSDQEEQFRKEDTTVLETGERLEIEEDEVETPDGGTRIYQTTKIPFELPGSDETAVLGYARDVTELKEYERQLESQRNNLEVLNKMVRHDIRNNLQLVLAYSETLESHVDETGEEYLEKVLESAQQAVEITQVARDVAEVLLETESGLEPIALRNVLIQEIENIGSRYDEAIIETPRDLPTMTVMGGEMLHSVVRNLLQNAISHNDAAVPKVRVSVEETEDSALVRFEDNGPGIPQEEKELIFEEGNKGLESEGSGLGLYLVQTVVENYGGDVRVVESAATNGGLDEDQEPLGGAVFEVELPLAD